MSFLVDKAQFKQEIESAFCNQALNFSNPMLKEVLKFTEFSLGDDFELDLMLTGISKPAQAVYERVPPSFNNFSDFDCQVSVKLHLDIPSCSISIDSCTLLNQPVEKLLSMEAGVCFKSLKFDSLINLALVNGTVMMWMEDLAVDPKLQLTLKEELGTEALSKYLENSIQRFAANFLTRMLPIGDLNRILNGNKDDLI